MTEPLSEIQLFPCENTLMFTGIITGVGRINAVHALGSSANHGKRLTIECPPAFLDDVGLGDNIAGLNATGTINLEKALRANDRLGGHMVSGHVDGIGTVTHFSQVGESWQLRVLAPKALAKYLAYKGSITVNGVSLTVNRVQDIEDGCEMSINLIPHTVQNTALNTLQTGSLVNLEIDLIARYVERMLNADPQQTNLAAP